MLSRKKYISIIANLIMILLVAACSAAAHPNAATSTPASVPVTGQTQIAVPLVTGPTAQGTAQNLTGGVMAVAEMVKPAIVQITTMQVKLNQLNQAYAVPAGTGSGVIYDKSGLVLTNDHVIAGGTQLRVSLIDGRSFPAKLLGGDPSTDLAVLQIQAQNLPVANLGDSNQLQIGEWVVAIGYALGLPGGPTVSAGVISALGRTVQLPTGQNGSGGPFLFDMLQTDAAINPGNSGGALVNLSGQVIGINTLVAANTGTGFQAQGIGFAIPIESAKAVADQLAQTGRAVHSYMGADIATLTPGLAAQLGINQPQGVLITNVVPGSPAEKAGLQQGDVIIAIDNRPIRQDADVAKILDSHKPGDAIALTIVRNNRQQTGKLILGEAPA
jgi:S1-C subfamily serine protease